MSILNNQQLALDHARRLVVEAQISRGESNSEKAIDDLAKGVLELLDVVIALEKSLSNSPGQTTGIVQGVRGGKSSHLGE